jgi:uncharacterized protein
VYTQIEVDVAVLSAGAPDSPRRVLSVKGYHAADAVLACYSGTGFSAELRAVGGSNPSVLLVDLERLYQS